MNKCFKIIGLLIFILLITIGLNNVYAASASLEVDKSTINVGESVTITASVTTTEAWNLKLTTSGGTLSGTTSDADSAGKEVSQSVMVATFTASSVGTYTITLSGQITGSDLIKQQVSKTTTITVSAPTPTPTPTPTTSTPEQTPTVTATPAPAQKSSNANLKNLGITPNDFSGFTASKTEYYVTVPYEVESIRVYAKKAESSQTISGEGDKTLEIGATTKCSVTVTAEDGTQKTYNIYVTRKSEPTETVPNVVEEPEELLKLSTLEVKNATISPEFNPDIYEYEISLQDENIEKLDILATANIENASIEVNGNENFMEGENTVTIVLKSEDGTKAATYTITVTKGAVAIEETPEPILEEEEPAQEEKKNMFSFLKSGNTGMIVILVIAVIVLIASIITVVVILVKNKQEANGEMMNFTPNSEYNVFEEKEDKKEEIETETEEKPDKEKRRGKHF